MKSFDNKKKEKNRSEKQKYGESNENWGRPTISENSGKSQLLFDSNNNGSWNSV